MLAKTALGSFPWETVHRQSATNFDVTGVSHRVITPNGDARNDVLIIRFDNPRDSGVSGRIFDLLGGYVADMEQKRSPHRVEWNGKAGGKPVKSGVYVFVLESESRRFKGAVVVIR
ncbi:MAG: gliding motility-associated C-terminal domain-containing protein [Elusimicrobia bacterium]|nr:gliding motility-associated C-terminal domain-containing protein [Elusimicrobiota bacterium]